MIEAPSLALAFAAGVVSFLSPCCLPLVPGYLAAIGEAKHTTTPRGPADLDRLDHIRALLPTPQDRSCRLLLFSATGFERNLVRSVTDRPDVELIDLDRLYGR